MVNVFLGNFVILKKFKEERYITITNDKISEMEDIWMIYAIHPYMYTYVFDILTEIFEITV